MTYQEFYAAEAKARSPKDWRVSEDHHGMPVLRLYVKGERTSVYVAKENIILDRTSTTKQQREDLDKAYMDWLNQDF